MLYQSVVGGGAGCSRMEGLVRNDFKLPNMFISLVEVSTTTTRRTEVTSTSEGEHNDHFLQRQSCNLNVKCGGSRISALRSHFYNVNVHTESGHILTSIGNHLSFRTATLV